MFPRCATLRVVTWTRDNEEKGRRVREARIAKGLTQKQVAVAIHANPSTISHIEHGSIGITRERAEALEPVIDVPADELADVASPSLLYLVKAIAEKLEIPLRLESLADVEARTDEKTGRVREQIQKQTTDQPQQAEG